MKKSSAALSPTTASNQGNYSLAILRAFIRQSRQHPCFQHWLRKVVYMRQLGYPLSPSRLRQAQHWQQLGGLEKWQQRCFGHRQRQLQNLIDEVTPTGHLPAVHRRDRKRVQRWRARQQKTVTSFEQHVTGAKRVIVVGNSPNIRGQALGQWIDQHDIVIRFNYCFSDRTRAVDSGQKLDYWVVAPDYKGPLFGPIQSGIITGPDMLWWRQHWRSLRAFKSELTGVPIKHWRSAVCQLQAPPSAGFLILNWLLALRPSESIRTIGFGFNKAGEYHHALKDHQPVSRHNWQREQELLNQWNLLNNPS